MPASTTSRSVRSEQIAAFYATNARRVRNIVRGRVRASEQTIEDACQVAWAVLLRRDDVMLDDHALGWLVSVAIREGWRQAGRDARQTPISALQPGELPEPASPQTDVDEHALSRVEHAQRVLDLRTLKPRERRDLYLHALGYRYREIAQLTDSTYTAVNRRITEGRAQLRRLEHEHDKHLRREASD